MFHPNQTNPASTRVRSTPARSAPRVDRSACRVASRRTGVRALSFTLYVTAAVQVLMRCARGAAAAPTGCELVRDLYFFPSDLYRPVVGPTPCQVRLQRSSPRCRAALDRRVADSDVATVREQPVFVHRDWRSSAGGSARPRIDVLACSANRPCVYPAFRRAARTRTEDAVPCRCAKRLGLRRHR